MPSWAIYGNERARGPGPAGAVVPFEGLGDVSSGWIAYYGVRAFDAAAAAGEVNAVRLRRGGDDVESDFAVQTNGSLDAAAITAWSTAGSGNGNLFVHTIYDQIGSADLVQTTSANQPVFDMSGPGSLPVLEFTAASSQKLFGTGTAEQQPLSIVAVANHGTTAAQSVVFNSNTVSLYYRQDADNQAAAYAGAAAVAVQTASDGNWHTVQNIINGASSTVTVDGSTGSSADIGADGLSSAAGNWTIGGNAAGGQFFQGSIAEVGINSGALSAGDLTAIDSNMSTYFGI